MPIQAIEQVFGPALQGFSQELEQLRWELRGANQLNATLVTELQSSRLSLLEVLTQAMDARDAGDPGHSRRVVKYALATAAKLGVKGSELEHLRYGVLLHDTGKLCISDGILNKPGPLTEEEWIAMRRHPEMGYQLLQGLSFMNDALDVVLYHHEHFDGSGYPYGLKGSATPQSARIFAVADAFDAMTADRPYRKAQRPEVAIEEIRRCSGTQFDPDVVTAFIEAWEDGFFEDTVIPDHWAFAHNPPVFQSASGAQFVPNAP